MLQCGRLAVGGLVPSFAIHLERLAMISETTELARVQCEEEGDKALMSS